MGINPTRGDDGPLGRRDGSPGVVFRRLFFRSRARKNVRSYEHSRYLQKLVQED